MSFDASLAQEPTLNWQQLANLPDSHGLASVFAGTHGSTLLVGGGANFPDRPPWDGGRKVWHDRVWALERPDANWSEVGHLPRSIAYGISISTSTGVICIGGGDATMHFADVFQMQFVDRRLDIKSLPSLPHPIANACGGLLGNMIYIAGGMEAPDSVKTLQTFYAFDLSDPKAGWQTLEPWPGPSRMLSVAAIQDSSFFLISGSDLSEGTDGKARRTYLKDAYRFKPGAGWNRIADVPFPTVAACSPAPTIGNQQFLVIGGDDGSNTVFQPPQDHPGFSSKVLAYDAVKNEWKSIGQTPAPRVTLPTVRWGGRWVMISGEQRPAVRSPAVWSLHE